MQNKNVLQDAPQKVRDLLDQILAGLKEIFADDLVGMYVYGSLAQGCFRPKQSDIDFTVVVKKTLTKEQEKQLFQLYKKISKDPDYGEWFEGVFFTLDQVKKAVFPSPFLFCFAHSKCRVPENEKDLDPDFPMTLRHLYDYGVALFGPEPKKLFLPPGWEILEPSIKEDVKYSFKIFQKAPLYTVLNLCRAIYALETKDVSASKKQAGEWALQNFPAELKTLIKTSLEAYKYGLTDKQKQFLLENLDEFITYCKEKIAKIS